MLISGARADSLRIMRRANAKLINAEINPDIPFMLNQKVMRGMILLEADFMRRAEILHYEWGYNRASRILWINISNKSASNFMSELTRATYLLSMHDKFHFKPMRRSKWIAIISEKKIRVKVVTLMRVHLRRRRYTRWWEILLHEASEYCGRQRYKALNFGYKTSSLWWQKSTDFTIIEHLQPPCWRRLTMMRSIGFTMQIAKIMQHDFISAMPPSGDNKLLR